MKGTRAAWVAAVVMGLGFAFGLPAWAGEEGAAEKATEPRPPKQLPEGERARVEKQLADVREKLAELQKEEMELSIKILKVESAALEKVEEPKNLKKNLLEGSTDKGVGEYRQACLACAEQWLLMESKYAKLLRPLQYVERKRGELPDNLKTSLEDVEKTIRQRRRGLFEKAAILYEKIYDERRALGMYAAVWQLLPEAEREADDTLKKKIVDLKNKIEGVDEKAKDTKKDPKKDAKQETPPKK